MAEKVKTDVITKRQRKIAYRCFNKDFEKPQTFTEITSDYHLERGEKEEVVIVKDRNIDWLERANKDVPNVGLANVLKLAQKGAISLDSLAFKDSEAGNDISMIDPMNINENQKILANKDKNVKKLESLAKSLGVSLDDLAKSLMDGTFVDLVEKAKAPKEEEKKEGE